MSFEPNNMNTIHLGNYEEFFVLYMDNELSKEQVKMVDDFLLAHPDLKVEFDILMSTKLPLEDYSFKKNDLFAESMKLSAFDEELLLYIDDELPAGKKKIIETELASNKEFQLQHQFLAKTKLDPSEKIVYPNKKELYHRTEKVIAFKMWMRVAAAVVIIAISGIVYFKNPPSITPATNAANTAVTNNPTQNSEKQDEPANNVVMPSEAPVKNEVAISEKNNKKERKQIQVKTNDIVEETPPAKNLLAELTPQEKIDPTPERDRVNNVQTEVGNTSTSSKVNLNTGSVTNFNPDRKPIEGPEEPLAQTDNDRKGSLKGFLRKATRMIEKRTGIDPTNANGELLIGAVAINLK
jgi:hypothetical protein